jgi:starch synthase (maltosyl-transferring)
VKTFRVDNPHTKPFAFWEWMLAEVRRRHQDVVFLSEAFTRRPAMYRLAKLGFSQSYTYFAWRNGSRELREYLTELTRPPVVDFFRPSLWPNTPDILNEYLQVGGRPASAVRLLLAATLGASYGIYGPAFELAETVPIAAGSEEYLNSEKYQIRQWDLERPGLQDLIARVNATRRRHPALQQDRTLTFLETDNEELLAYTKTAPHGSDPVLVVANLDWRNRQSGWVRLPAAGPGGYLVVDELDGSTYSWEGEWNFVELHPDRAPGHILSVGTSLVELA